MKKLHVHMTTSEFKQQYWYLNQLREFAAQIGIPAAKKLRKDELEAYIEQFLAKGEISREVPIRLQERKNRTKDSCKGLSLATPVINFTWDYVTRDFLENEMRKQVGGILKAKSGEKYWTMRWLEHNHEQKQMLMYQDIINHLIKLRTSKERLPRIPSTCYNNFITDFLQAFSHRSRRDAQQAWQKLKDAPVEKSFLSYKNYIEKKVE